MDVHAIHLPSNLPMDACMIGAQFERRLADHSGGTVGYSEAAWSDKTRLPIVPASAGAILVHWGTYWEFKEREQLLGSLMSNPGRVVVVQSRAGALLFTRLVREWLAAHEGRGARCAVFWNASGASGTDDLIRVLLGLPSARGASDLEMDDVTDGALPSLQVRKWMASTPVPREGWGRVYRRIVDVWPTTPVEYSRLKEDL